MAGGRRLLLTSIDEEDFKTVLPEIRKENRRTLVCLSPVAVVILALVSLVVFTPSEGFINLLAYLPALAVSIILFLVSRFCYKDEDHLEGIGFFCFLFMAALLYMGIILAVVVSPDQYAVSFIALLIVFPLIFTEKPLKMCIFIAAFTLVFLVCDVLVKEGNVRRSDLMNGVIYAVVSMVASATVNNKKINSLLLENQIKVLSEMDILTGLLNRNCFEKTIREYRDYFNYTISCVYVDVNGLHEINNTQSHEAGDRMLQSIAADLRQSFGKEDSFRVGGDEYVAFLLDKSGTQVETIVNGFRSAVEGKGFHVSIGCATQSWDALNIDALIKEAEKRMFLDKSLYYAKVGIDRRNSFRQ